MAVNCFCAHSLPCPAAPLLIISVALKAGVPASFALPPPTLARSAVWLYLASRFVVNDVLSLSVEGLANFINEFIDYKGFKRVNFLGNSLGGHVGLVFIKKYPQKVNSLVLTGSSGLYESAFGASYPKKGDKAYLRERIQLTFYNPASTTDELVDEVYDTLQDKGKVLRILTMAKSAIRHNMRKDLPGFTQPTCLIWGKQDTITPPEVAEEFHELLPRSELHFLEQCGHAPMMEKPSEFNHIVDTFLATVFSA